MIAVRGEYASLTSIFPFFLAFDSTWWGETFEPRLRLCTQVPLVEASTGVESRRLTQVRLGGKEGTPS